MNISKSMNPATLLLSTLLAAALLAACGKKDEEKPAETAPQGQQAPAAAEPILVTGNDQMQFNTKAFEVQSGSQVVIVMQNVGSMPKESMGHNLTILKQGGVVADVGAKAINAKETDYIPQGDTTILVHTRLLGPGESDTLRFTAPAPGEYPYLCTFPGHFGVMNGVMTSK